MTKSHTIVMTFLLITIISVGVVRNIRSTGWDNTGMLNAIANEQAALMSLIRLQSMGITEDQIINLARRMNNGQFDNRCQSSHCI